MVILFHTVYVFCISLLGIYLHMDHKEGYIFHLNGVTRAILMKLEIQFTQMKIILPSNKINLQC